jgi:hypothetical protein
VVRGGLDGEAGQPSSRNEVIEEDIMPTANRPPNTTPELETASKEETVITSEPGVATEPTKIAAEPAIAATPKVATEPTIGRGSKVTSAPRVEHRREAITRGVTVGGSTAEALLGITAVVLCIFALSGLLVRPLTVIAVIAASAALLSESASLAASSRGQSDTRRAVVLGGVSADSVAGIAGITLGVLALLGVRPLILLPVAALALGAGLLFSGATSVVELIRGTVAARDERAFVENPISSLASIHMIVGAGALVLGVLGVVRGDPILLTLIATLSIGAALLLSGTALSTRSVITPTRPLN